MVNFNDIEEYIEFMGDWQTRLLDIADNVRNTNSLHFRKHYRFELGNQFKTFMTEINELEERLEEEETSRKRARIEDDEKESAVPIMTNEHGDQWDGRRFIIDLTNQVDIKQEDTQGAVVDLRNEDDYSTDDISDNDDEGLDPDTIEEIFDMEEMVTDPLVIALRDFANDYMKHEEEKKSN